jgi:hypothetical protein
LTFHPNNRSPGAIGQYPAFDLKSGTRHTIVVWEFAVRELMFGNWKLLDMKLGQKRDAAQYEKINHGEIDDPALQLEELSWGDLLN